MGFLSNHKSGLANTRAPQSAEKREDELRSSIL